MSEHNFVTIGGTLYAFGSLDEVNRIFVGYRLTHEIITDFLDDKIERLEELKTTILFREQGKNDIYVHEATLNNFSYLYYVFAPRYGSHIYPSTSSYKEAQEFLKIYELQLSGNWFQRFIARHKNMEKPNKIIEEYEIDEKGIQEREAKYKAAKTLKEEWVLRVKEQWFS